MGTELMEISHIISVAAIAVPVIIGIITLQAKQTTLIKSNTDLIKSHIKECSEDKKELKRDLREDFNRVHARLDKMSE
jgi:hypothetical protein